MKPKPSKIESANVDSLLFEFGGNPLLAASYAERKAQFCNEQFRTAYQQAATRLRELAQQQQHEE